MKPSPAYALTRFSFIWLLLLLIVSLDGGVEASRRSLALPPDLRARLFNIVLYDDGASSAYYIPVQTRRL